MIASDFTPSGHSMSEIRQLEDIPFFKPGGEPFNNPVRTNSVKHQYSIQIDSMMNELTDI